MKFGKFIQGQQIEWAGAHHLNYKALKKVINAVEALTESAASGQTFQQPNTDVSQRSEFQALKTAFFFKLERELEKVNAFYLKKELEFKVRLHALVEKKNVLKGRKSSQTLSAFVNLKEAFASFQQDLAKLQKFVEVNREGFRKILKKWDKRAKSTTKELYLSRQVEIQPCFNNDVLTEFTDSATTNIAEIEAYIERGDVFISVEDEMPVSTAKMQPVTMSPNFGRTVESITDLENELISILHSSTSLSNLHAPIGLSDSLGTIDTCVEKLRGFLMSHKSVILSDDRDFFSRVFLRVISSAPVPALRLLIDESVVDCCYVDDINNRTSVHEAAIIGRVDVLGMCVEIGGGNLETLDVYGRRAMHYAAMYGKEDCLEYLLKAPSGDVNLVDFDGFTALTYSVIGGYFSCVKLCLEKAGLLQTEEGKAASTNAKMDAVLSSSLSLACEYGKLEIATLLLSCGSNLALNSDGLSPLHLVARAGHADLLALLIKHGGDVDILDVFQGWSPVFYAASEGHLASVELLLNAGCSKTIKDETDWNAWTYALYHGHIEIAKLLEIVEDTPVALSTVPKRTDFALTPAQIEPMRPSALFTAEPAKAEIEDFEMEELPSGHNYLDKKYLIQINLSSFASDISDNSPIKLFSSRQLSSLKLIISNKPDGEIPYNVILPLTDDSEPCTFFVSDPKEFSLQFDLFPTFGTKILGRSVVLSSQFMDNGELSDSENRQMVVPLFDSYLRVVGELKFSVTTVNAFIHPRMQIGGNVETYWKSTTVVNNGPKGHAESGIQSLITASSLAHEYINVAVQVTKDGVPVVYPSWFLNVNDEASGFGLALNISALNYLDALKIFNARFSADKAMQTDIGSVETTGLGAVIYDSFLTLEEVLKNTRKSVGLSIELKYPTRSEREFLNIHQLPPINKFLDHVLQTVYDDSSSRSLIFSSMNPLVCVAMNWKQPNFGVFFKTSCGIRDPNETGWKETDRRCGSIKEAIRFSKRSHFLGVLCKATPLIQVPALISTIKQSGLMLVSFGEDNKNEKNVLIQETSGVDGVMIEHVLKVSVESRAQ
ncbi:phosphate system positive regulatory protein pho81 [Entophlyctis luteolus]|nr:phosphate system positive regulatory protein pho81 [Entophlyctis luteolus]